MCGVVLHSDVGCAGRRGSTDSGCSFLRISGFSAYNTYEEKFCFGVSRITLEEACLALGINEKSVDRTNRTMVDSPGPDRTRLCKPRHTKIQGAHQIST